jgi:hypothetical protein
LLKYFTIQYPVKGISIAIKSARNALRFTLEFCAAKFAEYRQK